MTDEELERIERVLIAYDELARVSLTADASVVAAACYHAHLLLTEVRRLRSELVITENCWQEARAEAEAARRAVIDYRAIDAEEAEQRARPLPTLDEHIAAVRREHGGLTEGERLAVEESHDQLSKCVVDAAEAERRGRVAERGEIRSLIEFTLPSATTAGERFVLECVLRSIDKGMQEAFSAAERGRGGG